MNKRCGVRRIKYPKLDSTSNVSDSDDSEESTSCESSVRMSFSYIIKSTFSKFKFIVCCNNIKCYLKYQVLM